MVFLVLTYHSFFKPFLNFFELFVLQYNGTIYEYSCMVILGEMHGILGENHGNSEIYVNEAETPVAISLVFHWISLGNFGILEFQLRNMNSRECY